MEHHLCQQTRQPLSMSLPNIAVQHSFTMHARTRGQNLTTATQSVTSLPTSSASVYSQLCVMTCTLILCVQAAAYSGVPLDTAIQDNVYTPDAVTSDVYNKALPNSDDD